MFGNLGLHAMQFPSGKFGYVGSIPTALGYQVKADTSAVMGGRAFENEAGELVEWKFPVFDSMQAAVEFAAAKGFEAQVPQPAPTPVPGAKFEAGKTYWCTSICNSECVYTIKVIRRTAKTLYVVDEGGKAKTLRVKIGYYGHEEVAPKGSYSMSPSINASKVRT